jgi:uncharacterized protein YjbI with pentapeptide repeats
MITFEELMEVINDHQKWLAGTGGVRANLSGAYLSAAYLKGADLSGADLRGADLRGADLRRADLSDTDLSFADLSGANLSDADLRCADLRRANLSDADLRRANLSDADLSGAEGILNPIEYIEKNFEKTKEGIIVYKSFDENYTPNPNWKIEEGSIIEEVVNPLPTITCGCGINVATKEWAKRRCDNNNQFWECLIRWEWLVGVVVPYQTEGQIRASKVQLIKPVNCL